MVSSTVAVFVFQNQNLTLVALFDLKNSREASKQACQKAAGPDVHRGDGD